MESAFVASALCTFTSGTTRVACQRQNFCKSYCRPRWRSAAVPEEGLKDTVQRREGEISGSGESEELDKGLESALSRNWDSLQGFEIGKDDAEISEMVEEVKGEGEEGNRKEQDRGERHMETEVKIATRETGEVGQMEAAEEDIDRKNNVSQQKEVLESDAAIAAVKEAKQSRGRKKKDPTATTKKKARSTTSRKKREKKSDGGVNNVEETSGIEQRAMTQQEIRDSEKWDTEPRWFFLQVKPGCEQSCAISIRNMAQSLQGLKVQEVLVPETTILRLTKGGQSVKKEERIFPGYVMVLMVMNYQNYCDVQRVPNVQYFMGDPNRDKAPDDPFRPPIPVSDTEMKVVFDRVRTAGDAKPEAKTEIRPGDSVEVLWGSFQGNMGRVREVKPYSDTVTVRLLMFGRETPVELKMNQVKIVEDIMNVREGEEMKVRRGRGKEGETEGGEEEMKERRSKAGEEDAISREQKTAGRASAADDLAALLADIPTSDENENKDVGKEWLGSVERKNLREGRKKQKRAGKKIDDDFGFLDEVLGRQNREDMNKRTDTTGSSDALIQSDEELASFLSGEEGLGLWDDMEKEEGKTGKQGKKDKSDEEGEEDLFAFLDEFEEAEIIGEPEVGAQRRNFDG